MEAEMSYLLEEKTRRLENAEMLIERLNRSVERGKCLFLAEHGRSERLRCALKNFIEAYYRGLIGAVPDMPPAFIYLGNPPPSPIVVRNLLEEMVREAESALRTAEESSVVDGPPAKQPEGMTKLDKALQNIAIAKRILVENSCPSEFGLEDCEFNPESGCTLCCEDCWNQEVES